MLKYILKRIGIMLLTFAILVLLTFVLIRMMPPDRPKKSDIVGWEMFNAMGYDKPVMEQLGIWLKNIFTNFNWGVSMKISTGTPAWELLLSKLPASMLVGLGAIIIGIPLGLVFGYFAARKKNKWQDHAISTGVMVFTALPAFIFGFLVLYVLCFALNIPGWNIRVGNPAKGQSWWSFEMLWRCMPAIITLSFGYIASWTRAVRAELTEAMTSEYILLARTKGLTKGQAIRRHALKNAMVPLFPGIIAAFVGILSGAMITEQLFGINGVGGLTLDAMNMRDYDVFMVDSIFFLFIALSSSILFDISRGFLDPRIRVGSKKGGSY